MERVVNATKITGATRLYGILGDPIAQVRSPETFTARFAAAAMDAVLLPLHVPAERFDQIIPALMALGNLDGLMSLRSPMRSPDAIWLPLRHGRSMPI